MMPRLATLATAVEMSVMALRWATTLSCETLYHNSICHCHHHQVIIITTFITIIIVVVNNAN